VGTSFFRFVTMHAFDRRIDRPTDRPWQYHVLHYIQLHGKNDLHLHSFSTTMGKRSIKFKASQL